MVVIFSLLFSYVCLLGLLCYGWESALKKRTHRSHEVEQKISVVIAVRNEARNIEMLLQGLTNQQYKNYEILVVDDHSTDETIDLINKFNLQNLRVLVNAGKGKKAAITTGIKQAGGTLIATTDADCFVNPEWLSTINSALANGSMQMAIGGVSIQTQGDFFSDMQALEFSSLIGSGVAALALGNPVMCNGANLSYRKTAFEAVQGYDGNNHIPSGDDEFLMRKIAARFPKSITFIEDKKNVVATKSQQTVQDFFHQRIRWAGKWRHNASSLSKVLAVYIFLVQCATLFAFLMTVVTFNFATSLLLLGKLIFECLFLRSVCRHLHVRWRWTAFIALQVLYPIYVVTIGIASNFSGYVWKDRRHLR